MKEYIERERLLKVLKKNFGHTGGAAIMKQLIEIQPAADVVEVVRCRDCKYYEHYENGLSYCTCFESVMGDYPQSDDFCSYGKRKHSLRCK